MVEPGGSWEQNDLELMGPENQAPIKVVGRAGCTSRVHSFV